MANTDTDIANLALAEIGEDAITALTDQNKRARLAARHYPKVRDEVLRKGQWNCATKRATLSQDATAPVWGYANAYVLPPDFIRLAGREETYDNPRIEGQRLLSNMSEMKVKYVFRLEDVSAMDDLLVSAIALMLASKLAMSLKGSPQTAAFIEAKAQDKIDEARFVDATESPNETITGSEWTRARVGQLAEPYRRIEPAS